MPDLSPVFVHLLPSEIPTESLAGGVAIVIDILRATTVMAHALASGVESIRPFAEIDDARACYRSLPEGTAFTSGERRGVKIDGFDYGNSPGSMTPEVCRGKTLVMTTTNGTKAIAASLDAAHLLVAAFSNRAATVRYLLAEPRPIHLVCSGTDGLVSYEDALFAGLVVSDLTAAGRPTGNDSALLALGAIEACRLSGEVPPGDGFVAVLKRSRGGKRNLELGLEADVRAAAEWDRFDLVGELRRDPERIVRADDPMIH